MSLLGIFPPLSPARCSSALIPRVSVMLRWIGSPPAAVVVNKVFLPVVTSVRTILLQGEGSKQAPDLLKENPGPLVLSSLRLTQDSTGHPDFFWL